MVTLWVLALGRQQHSPGTKTPTVARVSLAGSTGMHVASNISNISNEENNMDYYIGQTFDGMYPPAAAAWCNDNNALMVELGGTPRRFRIDALPEPAIEDLRAFKAREIHDAFDSEINETGHITTSLDGFEVDARRRDYQNVQGIIEYYQVPITYKGYTSDRPNTNRDELKVIAAEIFQYGLYLYNKKWALEQAIEAAQSQEELDAISWSNPWPAEPEVDEVEEEVKDAGAQG